MSRECVSKDLNASMIKVNFILVDALGVTLPCLPSVTFAGRKLKKKKIKQFMSSARNIHKPFPKFTETKENGYSKTH